MDARITADENSAIGVEAQCGEARHDRASKPWFADLVQTLWPVKGPAAITQYAGCPDRTSRAYSSGDREPSATVLRDCIRGDEGYRVLKFIMAGSTATWWLVIQHERAVYAALQDAAPALRGILDAVVK